MSHHILLQVVFVGLFWRKFAVKEAFRSTSIILMVRFWWQLTCLSWKHRPALMDSTIAGVPPSSLLSISSTYTCLSFITCKINIEKNVIIGKFRNWKLVYKQESLLAVITDPCPMKWEIASLVVAFFMSESMRKKPLKRAWVYGLDNR